MTRIALCSALLLCLVWKPLQAQQIYSVKICVETTSNWTTVDFDGLEVAPLTTRLVGTNARADGFHIDKPNDGRLARLFATCYMSVESSHPRIVIKRGDVGRTRVIVSGGRMCFEALNQGRIVGDPTNTRRIPLDVHRLSRVALPPARPHTPTVLAFYYPWYATSFGTSHAWRHWDSATERHAARHTPCLGWYDSNDLATIQAHMRWARAAGIDGFIVSWWGIGSFEDDSLDTVLEAARLENFKVSVYVEDCKDATDLHAQLAYLMDCASMQPGWLKDSERPVFFLYSRVLDKLSLTDVRQALQGLNGCFIGDRLDAPYADVLDGVHTYDPTQPWYARTIKRMRIVTRARNRLLCGTVCPGYDDRIVRAPGRVIARQGGRFYERLWALASGVDWVLVTSFNEWHEGTEIEPSVELDDTYIELTRKLSDSWRARAAASMK